MPEQLRSGILGTGFMGSVHAQAVLSNGGVVAAILGSSTASSERGAQMYPGARAVSSIDEMVAAGVDVIHVCTPNALHREQAEAAIAAGVPVICEKPLATSSSDARALVESAAAKDLLTAIPFVYRYYPMVLDIRERIATRDGGGLWLLHGSYLQDWLSDSAATNWRVEPGRGGASRAFGDIGVHWCDLMEFVTGQRIVRVHAALGRAFERQGGQAQNATEDGGVISFETDGGAMGSLVISQASAGRRNRLWFSFDGPEESYSFDQEAPETAWIGRAGANLLVSRDPSVQSGDASRANALPGGHPQGYQTCFNDLVGDVYAAIRGQGRSDVLPSFADGLRAAHITEAVVASSRTRTWVDVDRHTN
ncbi:Gfo/Idh/MocA family protein [Leifsonia sp. NPDC058194]|uniref:Gfo/Idh/MocA family protein n=1 Tax=Leifsonia sp. NPDC058194 TaxID=3346374 RepID=UPI0036D8C39E